MYSLRDNYLKRGVRQVQNDEQNCKHENENDISQIENQIQLK